MASDCILCRGSEGDGELERVEVWRDDVWRLTTSVSGYTAGFSYLEPLRHVPYITDLDGAEAATFGAVIARCTSALKEATGSELVYVYVFGGGVPHLHLHLAPHTAGDALSDSLIRGEMTEEKQPSGVTFLKSKEFPELPAEELKQVAARIEALLLTSGE